MRYSGRVQGVGFRATARGVARGYALTGWVRNESDGSVLLEAQGEQDVIMAYLDELAQAVGGNVESAIKTSIDCVEGETGFEVRR